jgi:hypothetical protein
METTIANIVICSACVIGAGGLFAIILGSLEWLSARCGAFRRLLEKFE